jgi:Zn-dependent M28 family amino/carboxypeptidase
VTLFTSGIAVLLTFAACQPRAADQTTPVNTPAYETPSAVTGTSDGADPGWEEASGEIGPPFFSEVSCASQTRFFDTEQAMEHIMALTSDEMAGRRAGTTGGRAAGDYIAEKFAEYGLLPAGDDGTYFQSFYVPYIAIVEPVELTIILPDGEILTNTYGYRTDYRAITRWYAGRGEAEGQVVWLSDCLHDDYDWQDVAGKVVLCRRDDRNLEVYRQAIAHQVGALLMVEFGDEDEPFGRSSVYDIEPWVPQPIPVLLISRKVAQDLLIGTDYTLDQLSLRFHSVPLSTTVQVSVTTEEEEEVEARNVLGIIPGSDPEVGSDVIVVGAHYDHLGRDPDGEIYRGANDNASGVAVLLEIARLWQEQGCTPARSILFAAWDAEEMGLLGSRHFVSTADAFNVISNLNMDMLGVGEQLEFDGVGTLATQLRAAADTYGITSTLTPEQGGSDHVSFREARIPASVLGWQPDFNLHTVHDQASAIEPALIREAGMVSSHALSAAAQETIELRRAIGRMETTLVAGDREGFLAQMDPFNPDLADSQAAWFDHLWSRELEDLELGSASIMIGDSEANVRLYPVFEWSDASSTQRANYDVRFVRRDGRWYFGGYDLESQSGDSLTIERFPNVPGSALQILRSISETYHMIATDLGMEPVTGTRVTVYPSAQSMRGIARPANDQVSDWLVLSDRLLEVVWGQTPFLQGLSNLALTQLGLPADTGEWLREGLAFHYTGREGEQLPALAASEAISSIVEIAEVDQLPRAEAQAIRIQARSAVEYLLERHGSDVLRDLCIAWGETGEEEAAFRQALGISPSEFEQAWLAEWIEPLQADAEAIQATLALRSEAVQARDLQAFLATVSGSDRELLAEEQSWFAGLEPYPLASYEAESEVLEYSRQESEAIVDLSVVTTITPGQSIRINYDGRFVRDGENWYYAGVAWKELTSDRFVIKYQGEDDYWAARVLEMAEEAYQQVSGDLGATFQIPLQIKLYDDVNLFRASISPSAPRVTSWNWPSQSIRIWLDRGDERSIQAEIASGLARQILFVQGVESAWVVEGIAAYESGRAQALGTVWQARELAPVVRDAVRRHRELPMDALPQTASSLTEGDSSLALAQSWSLISYIAGRYGHDALGRFTAQSTFSNDTAANLRAALQVDPEIFWQEWRESAFHGGVLPDVLEMARSFDAEQALRHIAELSEAEYAGREAGSEGANLAASYLSDQFAELGLEPVGNPITTTEELSYLHWTPISTTRVSSLPTLTLLDGSGDTLYEFAYREEFLEEPGQGIVEGMLVWLNTTELDGLHFGGAVVIERPVANSQLRAAQLEWRGAAGLIIVTDQDTQDLQTRHTRHLASSVSGIPVMGITEAAFEILRERLDMSIRDFSFAPAALPLEARARLAVEPIPVTKTLSADVLGLIRGSDPHRADEVLVIGANYDHIGQTPDGLYFPGANSNASGVAAMLELLRAWQETGFRPKISVLFVAWGSEEAGNETTQAFLEDPPIPLEQIVGVIAIDSIAAGSRYRLLSATREQGTILSWPITAGAGALERQVRATVDSSDGWQALFSAQGLPTLRFVWDGAEYSRYDRSDTVDNLDIERLTCSGEILILTASWLARE